MSTQGDNRISQHSDIPAVTETPKKRKRNESKSTNNKKKRFSEHVTGKSCECTHLKCFEKRTADEREYLIEKFNNLESKNEQDCFLCNLIKTNPIQRRRSQKSEEKIKNRGHSFKYAINVLRKDDAITIPVCQKAFCSIFGIT